MSLKIVTKYFSQKEWNDIVSQFDDLNLIQLWEYGEAKFNINRWGVVRHIFRNNTETVGAAQAVVKKIPLFGKGLVWINRAPLWIKRGKKSNLAVLQEMINELRKYWVEKKGMYLRIAPTLQEDERNTILMVNCGYAFVPMSNWISAELDLTQPEKDLRMQLKQKWRNCLNKAEKLGITYEIGSSISLTDRLLSDYNKLLGNQKFKTAVTPEFLEYIQNILPENRKMMILQGKHGQESLGSILISIYGDCAEYIVGAVNSKGKRVNAGQFLLWNAICEMKKMGLRRFDVGGKHPEKTPKGVLHFKAGLGGKSYRMVGEFETFKGLIGKALKRVIEYKTSQK